MFQLIPIIALFEELWLTISRFWWVLPIVAVFIFIIFLSETRKVENRILYIRSFKQGGGTMELFKCRIAGSNIEFFPQKNDKRIVFIDSDPYLWIRGLSAFRVYCIVEGAGTTTNFSQSELVMDAVDHYGKALKSEEMIESEYEGEPDLRLKRLKTALPPIGKGGVADKPEFRAASASISFFERFADFIGSHLPKTKKDYIETIMYVVVGFLIGFAWGIIVNMKGIF